jgi:hypothetical protein
MLPVFGAPANLAPPRNRITPDSAFSTGPELALLVGGNVLSAADRELARAAKAPYRR